MDKRYEHFCEFFNEGNFIVYAGAECGVPENKAIVDWRNCHYKGKYVICESREGYGSRMFIRLLTNTYSDAFKKEGWWNTFCLSTNPVPLGLWLCSVSEYRLDRNNYVNIIVDPLVEVPKLKFDSLFDLNGTWRSPAIQFMFVGCNKFLPDYNFSAIREPNVEELVRRYPKYDNKNYFELCDSVLMDWLRGDINIQDIEDALNEKSSYEKLIKKIQKAIAAGKMEKEFPDYPLFAKKISLPSNHESKYWEGMVGYDEIDDYIQRNIYSYENLLEKGKMEAIDSNYPLDIVEAVLSYRKSSKKK